MTTLTAGAAAGKALAPGSTLVIGRADFLDFTPSTSLDRNSISRQHLSFALSADGLELFVTLLGSSTKAQVQRQDGTFETLVKGQPAKLSHGVTVFAACGRDQHDYPVKVVLSARSGKRKRNDDGTGQEHAAAGKAVHHAATVLAKPTAPKPATPRGAAAAATAAVAAPAAAAGLAAAHPAESDAVVVETESDAPPTVTGSQMPIGSEGHPPCAEAPDAANSRSSGGGNDAVGRSASPAADKAEGHFAAAASAEAGVDGVSFRALSLPWRPVGVDEPVDVAVILSLERGSGLQHPPAACQMLSVRVCDGCELRGTAKPVPCGWLTLPAPAMSAITAPLAGIPCSRLDSDALRATLRPHPLFSELWLLSLSRDDDDDAEPLQVELSKLRSIDQEGDAIAPLAAATTDGAHGSGRGASGGATGCAATSGAGAGDSDAHAAVATRVSMGLGGDMLRELVEHIDHLRSLTASEAAVNSQLQVTVAARAAELASAAERVRRAEATTLCGVLPLLLAKQRRLEQLEKELVDEDVPMWQDTGASDNSEGDGGT